MCYNNAKEVGSMLKKILNYLKKIGLLIISFFGITFSKSQKDQIKIEESTDEDGDQKVIKNITLKIKNEDAESKEKVSVIIKESKTEIFELSESEFNLGMLLYKAEDGEFIVYKVYDASRAHRLVFEKDDIITKINSDDTKTITSYDLKQKIKNSQNLIIKIKRKNENKSIYFNNPKIKEKNIPNEIPENKIITSIPQAETTKEPETLKKEKLDNTPKKEKSDDTAGKDIIINIPAIITLPAQTATQIIHVKKDNLNQEVYNTPKNKEEKNVPIPEPPVIEELTIEEAPNKVEEKQESSEEKKEKQETIEEQKEQEAMLLSKIIEEDAKKKQLEITKNQDKKKTILKLLEEDFDNIILPLPFYLFRYRIISSFFSSLKLNNSLVAVKNILNKNENYYAPSYLTFLSKKKTIKETERITLNNINNINAIKEDLIFEYGKEIKNDKELEKIMKKLDEIEENLMIKYEKLQNNKNIKVKRYTLPNIFNKI